MTTKKTRTLLIALLYCGALVSNIDSLLLRLKQTKDTAHVNTLVRLADQYMYNGKMKDAEECLLKAGSENAIIKNKLCEVFIALKNAQYRYKKSEFTFSYELCEEILLTAIETGDKNKIAECKILMGQNMGRLGNFKKALEFYQDALPLLEATGNAPLLMRVNSNIAGVYFDQLDYKMAIEYFNKTLHIAIEKNDRKIIGQTYNNIGSAIQNTGNSVEAKNYYMKAAEINLIAGNKNNLAYNYMNLASCELEENDIEKAREYNRKALQIFTDFNDPYSIVSCLCVNADIYVKEKQLNRALETLQLAEKQAQKTHSPLLLERVYLATANVYELNGDAKKALFYFKRHMHTRDSIVNDEIREEVTKKQLYYEFDKKHLSDSLEAQAKQKYLQQEVDNSSRRAALQRNISIISIFSFLIVAVLAFFIYRGLQHNKEANKLIGQKNREILDSFYYAKKIQAALLPPTDFIHKHLPQTFILYKPKDIVSGDFYWMHKVNSETILIAVGDCTGHGVPGAMVSVVCSNALNRAAKEFGLTEPGKILDKARELVIENFSESKSEMKDGMDISICKIDLRPNDSKHINVEWAGANNPLWYTIGNCMVEVDPDKQPIGNVENPKPFNTSEISLQKNEMLFLFTDGYADQFGGPKTRHNDAFGQGKKFKYRPLQDALLAAHKLPVEEQKENLEKIFEKWKGDLEQVDDVCIIGIRL